MTAYQTQQDTTLIIHTQLNRYHIQIFNSSLNRVLYHNLNLTSHRINITLPQGIQVAPLGFPCFKQVTNTIFLCLLSVIASTLLGIKITQHWVCNNHLPQTLMLTSHQNHSLWQPYVPASYSTMSDHSHTHQSIPYPHSANHMSTMSQDGQLALSTMSPGLPPVTPQSVYQRINESSLSASNLQSTSGEVLISSGTPQTQPSSDGSRHPLSLSGESTAWITV